MASPDLGLAAEHGLQVDRFILADVDLVAVGQLELLGVGVDQLVDGQLGGVGAALEDGHAVLDRVDAHGSGRAGDDVAVEIGGGGRLHDDGVGEHGAEQQRGDATRQLHALDLELARHDGGGGADGLGVEAQRLRGDQAAQAVMVDDLDDLDGVKAVGGLQGLVVVDKDDLLALGKGLNQTRRLDAVLAQRSTRSPAEGRPDGTPRRRRRNRRAWPARFSGTHSQQLR